jgi:hypothetical protein
MLFIMNHLWDKIKYWEDLELMLRFNIGLPTKKFTDSHMQMKLLLKSAIKEE